MGDADEPCELDRSTVQYIVERLNVTMRQLGEELDLTLKLRRATWSSGRAEIVIEAASHSADGVVLDKEAETFLQLGPEFGFTRDDLGREFACAQERLRIVGLRPRANAPVICEQVVPPTGKRFRMRASEVHAHLRAQKPRVTVVPRAENPSSPPALPSVNAAVRAAVDSLLRDRCSASGARTAELPPPPR